MDWSSFFRDVSVILASCTAIYGIDAWRREFRGKRQFELAEDVLTLFYEAYDAVQHIRSPAGFSGEGESRQAQSHETERENRLLNTAFVPVERYRSYSELFGRLRSIQYRFRAQFGVDSTRPFDDLRHITSSIMHSARMLAIFWEKATEHMSEEQLKRHQEKVREFESMIWSESGGDDVSIEMDRIISEIEKICHSVIAARGTLFSIINLPITHKSS